MSLSRQLFVNLSIVHKLLPNIVTTMNGNQSHLDFLRSQMLTMRDQMDEKIAEFREMRSTLSTLIDSIPNNTPPTGASPSPPAAATAAPKRRHFDLEPIPIGGAAAAKKSRNGDERKFSLDPEGYVMVFTDGACTNNGRAGAKAGIGVWWGDHLADINLSQAVVGGRHTNNTAEIQAATMAVGQAQGRKLRFCKLAFILRVNI